MNTTAETEYAIEDYRNAPSGEGPLASEWADKPHRLLYDLCSQVSALLSENARLKQALKPFAAIPSISLFPDGGLEMAKHYWAGVGTPNRSHFTQSDLIRARAALNGEPE